MDFRAKYITRPKEGHFKIINSKSVNSSEKYNNS